MKNIDFLPEIYTQNRVQRRAQAWWSMIAAAFAAMVLLAATTQWMMRRSIEQALAQLEPKHAEALSRQLQLQDIRQEIERAEEIADLYAYLAHPWPRSQLLAHVIRPLPDSVRLTEITIAHEALPAGPPLTPAASLKTGTKQTFAPAKIELALLRAECDGRQTVLTLVGSAATLSELHAYVAELGRSPLIAAAHVKGVETAATGNVVGESHFHVHVAVKPGYGQDGGPDETFVPVQSVDLRRHESALFTLHSPPAGGSP